LNLVNDALLIYDNNGVNIFDIASHKNISEPIKGTYLGISTDGRILATTSDSNSISFWDLTQTWPLGRPVDEGANRISAAKLSPQGNMAAWVGSTGIVLQDIGSGKILSEPYMDHSSHEISGDIPNFSPDGRTLAIGNSFTNTTTLWDINTQEQILIELPGTSMTFSPDGRAVGIVDFDTGTSTLWNLDTETQMSLAVPGENPIFSPDGRTVAIGDYSSNTTALWDLGTREQIAEVIPGNFSVLSSDGKSLSWAATPLLTRMAIFLP
jgi:WD40 repeat protein